MPFDPTTLTLQKVKNIVARFGNEESLVFENPDYATAFVGVDNNNRAVYDYELMVAHLRVFEGMDESEAREFIDYNTIRALPYYEHGPTVIFTSLEFMAMEVDDD